MTEGGVLNNKEVYNARRSEYACHNVHMNQFKGLLTSMLALVRFGLCYNLILSELWVVCKIDVSIVKAVFALSRLIPLALYSILAIVTFSVPVPH